MKLGGVTTTSDDTMYLIRSDRTWGVWVM